MPIGALVASLLLVLSVWFWRIHYVSRETRLVILDVSEYARALIDNAPDSSRWVDVWDWYDRKNAEAQRHSRELWMFWRPMSRFYPIAELDALYSAILRTPVTPKSVARGEE